MKKDKIYPVDPPGYPDLDFKNGKNDELKEAKIAINKRDEYISLLQDDIVKLTKQLEEAGEAMQEFVDRVDRGEVRSKYTYAKFKAILNKQNKED